LIEQPWTRRDAAHHLVRQGLIIQVAEDLVRTYRAKECGDGTSSKSGIWEQ